MQLSKIFTLFPIKEFLIILLDPIEQLSPIITFCSMIVLWPIKQLDPSFTFFPIKTFKPCLILLLYSEFSIETQELSKSSFIASG